MVLGRVLRHFAQAGFLIMAALALGLDEARAGRVAELLRVASIEISPHDKLAGEGLCDFFAPGRTVFVNHPASAAGGEIVAACVRLRRAGFVPVPHIAARRLKSIDDAVDFLRRATDEADIADALLIGGDPSWSAGPFRDSLSLLESGLLECHGLDHVLFAGYPEGHPHITQAALDKALAAKLTLAQRGLAPAVVTQFGFEAPPIQTWVAQLRGRGIACPVRVGLAGPASVAALVRFAVRCGVGSSLRALARGHTAFARILTEAAPDALIDALVSGETEGEAIDGLHIFMFGGVARTAAWLRQKI
jgi:methylenetetrahydrofolate reductase (NADPH)